MEERRNKKERENKEEGEHGQVRQVTYIVILFPLIIGPGSL